jgi:hypothetical protein
MANATLGYKVLHPRGDQLPKRTLGLETLQVRPGHNRRHLLAPLDDVNGVDLLHYFYAWATQIDPDDMVDYQRGRYLKITGVSVVGRSVVVEAESGYFGDPGKTIDVATHTVAHERTSDQSATIMTRMMLMIPPGSVTGVFVVERQGLVGAGPRMIASFKRALMDRFPSYSFDTETVLETAAWAEGAELLSIKAVAYGVPVDIGDGVSPEARPVGRLEQVLEPERGKTFLPRGLYRALRERRVRAADFMGFRGDVEVDETFVTLSRDGRKKTFNLEQERVPAVRVLITNDGEAALSATPFLRRCQSEVQDYFEGMELSWDESWQDGQWTEEAMTVRLIGESAEG